MANGTQSNTSVNSGMCWHIEKKQLQNLLTFENKSEFILHFTRFVLSLHQNLGKYGTELRQELEALL